MARFGNVLFISFTLWHNIHFINTVLGMTTASTISLLFAGVILFNLVQKGGAVGTLNFYPANIRDIGFDGSAPVAKLGIAIQNPSNQAITLKSFVANLTANGSTIGNVSSYVYTTILPNSETTYILNCRLSFIGLVYDIVDSFKNNSLNQDFSLEGFANVGGIVVPVKIKYKLP